MKSTALLTAALSVSGLLGATEPATLLPRAEKSWIYMYEAPTPEPDSTTIAAEGMEPDADSRFFEFEQLLIDEADEYEPLDSLPLGLVHAGRPIATRMAPYNFRPVVFDSITIYSSEPSLTTPARLTPLTADFGGYDWLNEEISRADLVRRTRQHYFVNHPDRVDYIEALLPEPPRHYTAAIDPETATVVFREIGPVEKIESAPELTATFDRKHWLKKFSASLQFSQAYVSPNWYQGGDNNLNALINLYYNVRLNPAFHPKWIFENTLQYKLGANNAPDDKYRDYNVSEDIFQWNMTAGYRSARRWYYSLTAMFKTQLLNNYKPNSNDLKAAFLSPAELNVGVGMTYAYVNPKKTVKIDASISPFSWNMKSCTRDRMDETSFGIDPGKHVVNEFGSSVEVKLQWQLCDNIAYRSRLFAFTDYHYAQGDWENTIEFRVNKFLSTQIYVHARYDSTTARSDNGHWHKWQLKEILSFGLSYQFSTP